MKRLITLALLAYALLPNLFAHSPGENYVYLEFHDNIIEGRAEFSLEDLKEKLNTNVKEDGEVSVALVQQSAPEIQKYINENFSIAPLGGSPYKLNFLPAKYFKPEGGWVQYEFVIESGPVPAVLEITHEMCYENDRTHRGLIVVEEGDWPAKDYKMQIAMVFSASNSTQTLDTQNPPKLMTPIPMIWQGILHIWIGIDHILFLLALALPIVLVLRNGVWEPAPKLGTSLWSLLRIVTVFTIAHSVTLLLASLEVITLPSRLVESFIALSIILVAVNNVLGRSQNTSLIIILLLGLFHGLGFASVMGELPFRVSQLKEFILIIISFNFGVELGQLAILLVVFPIIFVLRKWSLYSLVILKGGSAILALVATYWFIERAFDL